MEEGDSQFHTFIRRRRIHTVIQVLGGLGVIAAGVTKYILTIEPSCTHGLPYWQAGGLTIVTACLGFCITRNIDDKQQATRVGEKTNDHSCKTPVRPMQTPWKDSINSSESVSGMNKQQPHEQFLTLENLGAENLANMFPSAGESGSLRMGPNCTPVNTRQQAMVILRPTTEGGELPPPPSYDEACK